MLTPKERKIQANLARKLTRIKREIAKDSIQARSGNVACYLNSLTGSKLASKGFYHYDPTLDEAKIKRLSEQIYGYSGSVDDGSGVSTAPIVRIVRR